MTQIAWPRPFDPLTYRVPIIFMVAQNISTGAATHTHSAIPGLQAGDLMVVFTTGAFRVTTVPVGWTAMGDTGAGGSAMAASAFAKFAASSAESVTLSWPSTNAANASMLVVYRGATRAWQRSAQTNSAVQTSAPMTFPTDTTPVAAGSGQVGPFPLGTAVKALMLTHTANAGMTFTPVPTPFQKIDDYTTPTPRSNYIFELPYATSYSATPSATGYQAGLVVHMN